MKTKLTALLLLLTALLCCRVAAADSSPKFVPQESEIRFHKQDPNESWVAVLTQNKGEQLAFPIIISQNARPIVTETRPGVWEITFVDPKPVPIPEPALGATKLAPDGVNRLTYIGAGAWQTTLLHVVPLVSPQQLNLDAKPATASKSAP